MHLWIITLQWEDHRGRVCTTTLAGRDDLRGRSKADMLDKARHRTASDAGVSVERISVLVFSIEPDSVPL